MFANTFSILFPRTKIAARSGMSIRTREHRVAVDFMVELGIPRHL